MGEVSRGPDPLMEELHGVGRNSAGIEGHVVPVWLPSSESWSRQPPGAWILGISQAGELQVILIYMGGGCNTWNLPLR